MTTQLDNSRPLMLHAPPFAIVLCAPEVTKRAQLRQNERIWEDKEMRQRVGYKALSA